MMGLHWVIDRFEGDTAVLEHTDTLEIKLYARSLLPAGAKEGDTLVMQEDGSFNPDPAVGRERALRIQERFKRLTKR